MDEILKIFLLALRPKSEELNSFFVKLFVLAAFLLVACMLLVIGLGFLVWSSYLYFETLIVPPLAALASGVLALAVGGIVVLAGHSLIGKSHERRKKVQSADGLSEGIAFARNAARKYPIESSLTAAIVGFLAGSSGDNSKIMSELMFLLRDEASE